MFKKNRKNLDDFFIWPPDLFALTSRIFSLTGIYKNVLIKSNEFHWPPNKIIGHEFYLNGEELPWSKYATYLGQMWRQKIDAINNDNPIVKNDSIHYHGVLLLNQKKEDQQLIEATIGCIKSVRFGKNELIQKLKKFLASNLDEKIFTLDSFEKLADNKKSPEVSEKKFELFKALMTLHAIADEFSSGFCIRSNNTLLLEHYLPYNRGNYQHITFSERIAKTLLEHNRSISRINPEKCNILPKRQTPHTGITLRSVSGNLAYHRSSVEVKWHFYYGKTNDLFDKLKEKTIIEDKVQPEKMLQKDVLVPLNILLIPWPFHISSKDFVSLDLQKDNGIKHKHEYFKFMPKENDEEKKFYLALDNLIKKAKEENDQIDIIVLPETAIDEELTKILIFMCLKHKVSGYVIGKREFDINDKNHTNKLGSNYVQTQFFDYENAKIKEIKTKIDEYNESEKYFNEEENVNDYFYILQSATKQNKHHRWKLNAHQIKRSNLGSSLSTNKNWWEGISIKKRKINFFNLGEEITMCSLICEDLARQDPIADLLRSVGPNLVFTLLMDGEQLKHRWSARYASILSDDPGSAVITLTSLGMINRHTESNKKSSKSIGIISDSKGNFTEIVLPNNSYGALVTLNLNPVNENLADRQNKFCYTNHLTLGGIFYL